MAKRRTKYRTVKGKLGVFGWTSRILLVIWNIAMIVWLVAAGHVASESENVYEEVGAATGIVALIAVWVAGVVIIGIWALLTRAPKTLVPIEDEE